MLFWVALPIKLLEFRRLVATRHVKRINPLGVELSLAHTCTQLHLDRICNQVLDLLDGHQAWRPIILEFTTLLCMDFLVRGFNLDGRPLFLFTFGAFGEGSSWPLLKLFGQPSDLFLL